MGMGLEETARLDALERRLEEVERIVHEHLHGKEVMAEMGQDTSGAPETSGTVDRGRKPAQRQGEDA